MADVYICQTCGREEEVGGTLKVGIDPRFASGKCYICKGKKPVLWKRKENK